MRAPTLLARRPLFRLPALLSAALLGALLIAGCSAQGSDSLLTRLDLRPVSPLHAVGLLAPFEGAERRSGYDALAALRGAIEGVPVVRPRPALLPLALDTSRDAARAAQQLALDPTLVALLGPLAPRDLPGADESSALRGQIDHRWLAPFALTGAGFVAPDDPAWLRALLTGAAQASAAQGATRLHVAGWEPGDRFASLESEGFAPDLPIVWEEPRAPAAGDAILWLGDGAGAAALVLTLRSAGDGTPVWLAPWAADALFFDHLRAGNPFASSESATSVGNWEEIYSLAWLADGYDVWAAADPNRTPAGFALAAAADELVRRAQTSAPGSAGDDPPAAPPQGWSLRGFRIAPDGAQRLPGD